MILLQHGTHLSQTMVFCRKINIDTVWFAPELRQAWDLKLVVDVTHWGWSLVAASVNTLVALLLYLQRYSNPTLCPTAISTPNTGLQAWWSLYIGNVPFSEGEAKTIPGGTACRQTNGRLLRRIHKQETEDWSIRVEAEYCGATFLLQKVTREATAECKLPARACLQQDVLPVGRKGNFEDRNWGDHVIIRVWPSWWARCGIYSYLSTYFLFRKGVLGSQRRNMC